MKHTKKHLWWLIPVILLIIQFFPINKSVPQTALTDDFVGVNQMPNDIAVHFKGACYDCHSNETNYPWYTDVAPVSWWIAGHIKNGRNNLNFSEWGTYPIHKQISKLEESYEVIEDKRMPPKSYRFMHKAAQLSEADKTALVEWLKAQVETTKARL